jgi:hypothetical protein
MRRWSAALLLLFAAPAARAAFDSGSAGTSAAEFLKFGADARGVAMGQAMTAAADGASSLYWNPAGLSQLPATEVSFSHAFLYRSVFSDFAVIAQPLRPIVPPRRRETRPSGRGTIAAGLLYLNAGQIKERDNQGNETGGDFTPRDLALIAGWGATVSDVLDLGVALKYIDSRIRGSARAAAGDAGLRLRLNLGRCPYVLALSGHNWGGPMRYHKQEDPLPSSIRVGQSLRPFKQFLASMDLVGARDHKVYPAFGGELSFPLGEERQSASLRFGWSGRTSSSDLDGTAGISFGGGFMHDGFFADYAWVPFGVLGMAHRFTLGYAFEP